MSLFEFADKHPVLVFLLVVILFGGLNDIVKSWRK